LQLRTSCKLDAYISQRPPKNRGSFFYLENKKTKR